MFRSFQIIIRELYSLLKLYYGIHNSIRICKRGVVAAYHVVWECVVMLPQHLVCKYELNCEYWNITLARNKAPWWWSDKIETCRSVLKCFKWNYMFIIWLINWSGSTKMHGVKIRYIYVYMYIYVYIYSIIFPLMTMLRTMFF